MLYAFYATLNPLFFHSTPPLSPPLDLADVGGQRESMLAVTIPETPGAFLDFLQTAIGDTDIDVTEFKYR